MNKWFVIAGAMSAAFEVAGAADCDSYARQLVDMRVSDQALREYFVQHESAPPRINNALSLVDRTNTGRLKELLRGCGWPVASRYGREASSDAWLLIQHADQDRPFQREALRLLEQAVKVGEARGGDLAYLSDRLAVADGRPQPYGTQFKGIENCRLVLAPFDGREAVNARRKAIPGMPSLEEYERLANEHLVPPDCRRAP